MSDTKITVFNENSYGQHSTPEIRTRYTMEVEFILYLFPGAWDQPEDLMNWIAQHSYVTKVTHDPNPTDEQRAADAASVLLDVFKEKSIGHETVFTTRMMQNQLKKLVAKGKTTI